MLYLTFEELQILVVEVESILNSRPIAPMAEDPNDGEALKLGHLIIGSPLVELPEENLILTKPGSHSHIQRISYLKNRFWKAWSKGYLSLQGRAKWSKVELNVSERQLVFAHEDNTPSQQ